MMIYAEPSMTNEELTKLGQQLAHLFKQVGVSVKAAMKAIIYCVAI